MSLWIIAAANVVVWTGLFLALLFALMRGEADISQRLDEMEAHQKDKQPK